MVAGSLEDRRQVQGVGAQVLDVIELVNDALQIAAEEVVVVGGVGTVAATRPPGLVEPVFMQFNRALVVACEARLRVVARLAIAETIRKDVVVDDVACPIRHLEIRRVNGLAKTPDGSGRRRLVSNFSKATGALFPRPEDRVGVVLVNESLAADLGLKPVAVNADFGEAVAGTPTFATAVRTARHGMARHLGVFQPFLIAFHATLFQHQSELVDTRNCADMKIHGAANRHGAERGLVSQGARIETQAQSRRVSDGACCRVGKRLGTNVELRPATRESQSDRVFAGEWVRQVASATGQQVGAGAAAETGSLLPGRVRDLEIVTRRQLDVEVVGITAVLERVLVQRRPVVHAAAQEQGGLSQWRVGRAVLYMQGGGGVGSVHGQGEAMYASKKLLQFRALQCQLFACLAAAKIGIRRPRFIGNLEFVRTADPAHQLVALAGPAELLAVCCIPAIERSAQVERATTQWLSLAACVGQDCGGLRRALGQQQDSAASGRAQQRSPMDRQFQLHPLTPPAVRPDTIQRCAARKTSVMGRPDSTAAAAKSPHRYFCS